jgi:hypothetical protein
LSDQTLLVNTSTKQRSPLLVTQLIVVIRKKFMAGVNDGPKVLNVIVIPTEPEKAVNLNDSEKVALPTRRKKLMP